MEPYDDLQRYLQEQGQAGRQEDEGVFTLNEEQALRKLANFQLPFETAWILKVVQAAVRAGFSSKIEIKLERSECVIAFGADPHWDAETIKRAVLYPGKAVDAALDHLVTGLRALAVKGKRPFSLEFPEGRSALVWSGESFDFEPSQSETCLLKVRYVDPKERRGLFSGRRVVAGLTKVLYARCFGCPVPLTLDGKRLDSFYNNPSHGLSNDSFPVQVDWFELASIPPLPLPKMKLALPTGGLIFPGIENLVIQNRQDSEIPATSSVFHILCVHFERKSTGRESYWDITRKPSTVYWLADGVIIDVEKALSLPTEVSSCFYLSADDLETDLSGFKLLKSETRKDRIVQALRAARPSLERASLDPLEQEASKITQRENLLGALAGGVGTAMFLGMKPLAIPVGAAIMAINYVKNKQSAKARVSQVVSASFGLQQLLNQYRKRLGKPEVQP
jgi:hypothetical protein